MDTAKTKSINDQVIAITQRSAALRSSLIPDMLPEKWLTGLKILKIPWKR